MENCWRGLHRFDHDYADIMKGTGSFQFLSCSWKAFKAIKYKKGMQYGWDTITCPGQETNRVHRSQRLSTSHFYAERMSNLVTSLTSWVLPTGRVLPRATSPYMSLPHPTVPTPRTKPSTTEAWCVACLPEAAALSQRGKQVNERPMGGGTMTWWPWMW